MRLETRQRLIVERDGDDVAEFEIAAHAGGP